MNTTNPEFNNKLQTFVNGCQNIVNNYFTTSFPESIPSKLVEEGGSRYAKIISYRNGEVKKGHGTVYCFVDKTNGDVLKAATWKQPAKGARGNIFASDNGLTTMTPHGAAYKKTRTKKAEATEEPLRVALP